MKTIKVGQIWRSFNNDYILVKKVGFYIHYEVITKGHIAGSCTSNGFYYNHELINEV